MTPGLSLEAADLAMKIAVPGDQPSCDLAASMMYVIAAYYAGPEWHQRMTAIVHEESKRFQEWSNARVKG